MNIDLEELAAVVRLLKESEFSEFRYAKGDVSVVVRRGLLPVSEPSEPAPKAPRPQAQDSASQPVPAALAPGKPVVSPPARSGGQHVKAPLLGTFYGAPKPGEPPFVQIGTRVDPDSVVCIIEVMKLMNSVVAGVSGVISAIHAADGELVEHGQALFEVIPVAV